MPRSWVDSSIYRSGEASFIARTLAALCCSDSEGCFERVGAAVSLSLGTIDVEVETLFLVLATCLISVYSLSHLSIIPLLPTGIFQLLRHQEEGRAGACRQVQPVNAESVCRDEFNLSCNMTLVKGNEKQTLKPAMVCLELLVRPTESIHLGEL